jgi:hypothetical protein
MTGTTVTNENFIVAETDRYFSEHVAEHPVNTIRHSREPSGPDNWIKTKNFALNNRRAEANPDGSVTFCFNCPGQPNNIDTVEDWLMIVRLYQAESVEQIIAYVKDLQANVKIETCA